MNEMINRYAEAMVKIYLKEIENPRTDPDKKVGYIYEAEGILSRGPRYGNWPEYRARLNKAKGEVHEKK